MSTREQVFAALFALAQTAANVKTASRRAKHWDDCKDVEFPCLFQMEKGQSYANVVAQPAIKTYEADLYVYTYTGNDPNKTPSIQLNNIVDAIEAALAPDSATLRQTLGGLALRAWISGSILTSEGTLGSKAVAIIPIKLMDLEAAPAGQYSFDAGYLFALLPGTPDNWAKIGSLTQVSVAAEFTGDPIRSGKYLIPHGMTSTALTFTGKASFAKLDGALINQIILGQAGSTTSGATLLAKDVAVLIPGTPYTVTPIVPAGGAFAFDLGLQYKATGISLARVASGPGAGQYSFSAGTYTFAAADTAKDLVLNYAYTTTAGRQLAIGNPVQNLAPKFKLLLNNSAGSAQSTWILNAGISRKFLFAPRLDVFTVPDFDFVAVADSSNALGNLSFSQ